jgi:hypothetical protein
VHSRFRRPISFVIAAVLAVGVLQPVAESAASAAVPAAAIAHPIAAARIATAAAPRPMTLAQRHAQVAAELGGLSPVAAEARDHLATKPTGAPHAPVGHEPAPSWLHRPSRATHSAVKPAAVPPEPEEAVASSFVYPGDITLGVDTEIPSGTSASSLEAFGVLVYNTSGTLVYSQTVPESTNPTTYNGQESGGYCYGWWPPSSYPANWCFWQMSNVPGGTLQDGQTYFAQVLFESTTGEQPGRHVLGGRHRLLHP